MLLSSKESMSVKKVSNTFFRFFFIILIAATICESCRSISPAHYNNYDDNIFAIENRPKQVSRQFAAAEVPSSFRPVNPYFTNQANNDLREYPVNGNLTIYIDNSGRANSSYYDRNGNLVSLPSQNIQPVTRRGKSTVMTGNAQDMHLYQRDDLPVQQSQNIYFTDPNRSVTYTEPNRNVYFTDPNRNVNSADPIRNVYSTDPNKNVIYTDPNRNVIYTDPNRNVYSTDANRNVIYTNPNNQSNYQKQPAKNEQVYHIPDNRKRSFSTVSGVQKPNGMLATPDGKYLYIADMQNNKTYKYQVNDDGSLYNQQVFADQGSDGMTMDNKGNIYLTGDGVSVYSPQGNKIDYINVPAKRTSNVSFGGKNRNKLYITAADSIYVLNMDVKGAQ